jgi:hypothetical protein
MEGLASTRAYARSALTDSPEAVVRGCTEALARYGFCVIDHAIPPADVAAVHAECVEATPRIDAMRREMGRVGSDGMRAQLGSARDQPPQGDPGVVASGGLAAPYQFAGKNELHFLPQFAAHLGAPLVTAVARAALDSHVRVAQFHVRHVPPDQEVDTGKPSNSAIMPSGRGKRGWHTDCAQNGALKSRLFSNSADCTARGYCVPGRAARPLGIRAGGQQRGRGSPALPGRLHVPVDGVVSQRYGLRKWGDLDRTGP